MGIISRTDKGPLYGKSSPLSMRGLNPNTSQVGQRLANYVSTPAVLLKIPRLVSPNGDRNHFGAPIHGRMARLSLPESLRLG